MAVQTKTNIGDKPRQKKDINWTKVGVVCFCVLIVVMCIISFSGLSTIFNQNPNGTLTGTVEAGDIAEVEYTMYINTTAMVTSSFDVVINASSVNKTPAQTPNLGVVAGQQVDVANESALLVNSSYEYPFRMLNQERNQIATGVIGLGVGQSRTVQSTGDFFKTTYTRETAEEMGVDYVNWTVGTIGIMNFPTENETGNTTMAMRPALVTSKTEEEMVLQYGYDTIEMKVIQAYRTNA